MKARITKHNKKRFNSKKRNKRSQDGPSRKKIERAFSGIELGGRIPTSSELLEHENFVDNDIW